jgi:hypothetical protein
MRWLAPDQISAPDFVAEPVCWADILATEALPGTCRPGLSPRGRMFVDANRRLSYFRLSLDGKRVLFGGRLHLRNVDERTAATA